MLPELSREEYVRYSRHLVIPEVGIEGQRKLKAASVLIVGTGGLGSPISMYLAAAGIGRIGLVDYDRVDFSNLQRQIVHGTSRVGELKVESAWERLSDLNPNIQVDTWDEVFSSENAERIAADYDILVDGTDNFPTRYLLNDLAVLTGKPYVYGSIFRFEGHVSVFDARVGPCYRCLFPEPPPPGSVPSCTDAGVFGILPGTVGTLQATEVIKLILGIGEPLVGKLLLYDALDSSLQKVTLRKNPDCVICGKNPSVDHLIDYEDYCGVPVVRAAPAEAQPWDIFPLTLAEWMKNSDDVIFLDVRSSGQHSVTEIPGALWIPFEELPDRLAELDRNKRIVVACRAGVRSIRALEYLSKAGFERVYNLRGGTNAWAEQVDPRVKVY